ncbi:hypothetical protein BZA77DRAFT_297034 [Pyronema omphalodes]|nr:hypothetical protein BZA77DRAFT_297034 [Pyronema omphalodes]
MTLTDSILDGWKHFTSCFTSCFKSRSDTVTGFRVYGAHPENRVQGIPHAGRTTGINNWNYKGTNGRAENSFELQPWKGQYPYPTIARGHQGSHHSEFSWDPSIRGTKISLAAIPEGSVISVYTTSPAASEEALSRKNSEAGTITQEIYTQTQTASFYSLPKLSRGSTLRQDMFARINSTSSQSSLNQAPIPGSQATPYASEPSVSFSAPVSRNSSIDTIRYHPGSQKPIQSSMVSRNASIDTIRGMVDIPLDDTPTVPVRNSTEILSGIMKEREESGVQIKYGRKPKVTFVTTPTPSPDSTTTAILANTPQPAPAQTRASASAPTITSTPVPGMARQLVGTPPAGLMKQNSPPPTPRTIVGKQNSSQHPPPPPTTTTATISDLQAHKVQQRSAQSVYPLAQGQQRIAASSSDDNFSKETRRSSVNKGTQRLTSRRLLEERYKPVMSWENDDEVDEDMPLMNFDLWLRDLQQADSDSEAYYYNNDTFDERVSSTTTSSFFTAPAMTNNNLDSFPEFDGPESGVYPPYSSGHGDFEYEPSFPLLRSSGSILRVTNPDLAVSELLSDLDMTATNQDDSDDPFLSDDDDDDKTVVPARDSDSRSTSPADDLIRYANWRRLVEEERRLKEENAARLRASYTPPISPKNLQTYRRPSIDMENFYDEDMNGPSRSSSTRTLRVCNPDPDPEEDKAPVDTAPDEASDDSLAAAKRSPDEAAVGLRSNEINGDAPDSSFYDMESPSAGLTAEDLWFRKLVNLDLDYDKGDMGVISYDERLTLPAPAESLVVNIMESKILSPSNNTNRSSLNQPTSDYSLSPTLTTNTAPSILSPVPATPSPSITATVKGSLSSHSPSTLNNTDLAISPDTINLWNRVIEHLHDSDDSVFIPGATKSVNQPDQVVPSISTQPNNLEKETSPTMMMVIEVPQMIEPTSQVITPGSITTTNDTLSFTIKRTGFLTKEDNVLDITDRPKRFMSEKPLLPATETENEEWFRLKNGVEIGEDIKKRREELIQRSLKK